MNDSDFDKEIDLHESEWHHEEKREPILGPNGAFFFIMLAIGIPIGWVCKVVVEFVIEVAL